MLSLIDLSGVSGQAVRFCLGGGLVTLAGALVYSASVYLLRAPPLSANFAAYLVAVLIGFRLHAHWSFGAEMTAAGAEAFSLRFFLSSLIGLCLNSAWAWWLGDSSIKWLPLVPMILVTPPVAFLVNRLWVFKQAPAEPGVAQRL